VLASSAAPSLFEALQEHARSTPSRRWLSFVSNDGSVRAWTYGEFLAEVEQAASALATLRLERGDTFVICADNHPDLIRLVLAAAASGRIAVPADTRLTERELGEYFEVSGARVLFTTQAAAAAHSAARRFGALVVELSDPLGESALASSAAEEVPLGGASGDVFELLFTSGTTSRPKGVMLTNGAVVHGSTALAVGAGYRPGDAPLVTLPLYHAAAQMHQLWPTLVLGGRAVVIERFQPEAFFGHAVAHGTTSSAQFAATLRLLLRRGSDVDARRGTLRHITFAQSLTAEEHADWQSRFGIGLQQLWGMTETVGLPLMSPLEGDRRLAAVGKPVTPYYDVVVRTDDGRVADAGEPGEITVRAEPGVNVMLGYFRNEQASAAALRGGWLHSGDMAYYDDEQFVHFLGRAQDLIRRGATNFSALEVEQIVREVPGVLDVAVVGVPDALGDETVAAFVVRTGDRPGADEIRAHCRSRLAAFKRPHSIEFVADLPRTAVGKVQKHLLRDGQSSAIGER
jgi:crotonobetaine/carnitine-CoA ligase